jgi:hypothetical protein
LLYLIIKPRSTLVTKHRIVIKWEQDEGASFISDDCCHAFETNHTDREYASQVDIMGTYHNLVKMGGRTPEQARQQTSWAFKRLRRWHMNDWNYVGCVVTIPQAFNAGTGESMDLDEDPYDYELEDWEELHDESLWMITSDCGDYRYEVEAEQIHELLSNAVDAGTLSAWCPGTKGTYWVVFPDNSYQCIEVEEDEDSWYMSEPMSLDDSELLPEWSQYFDLQAKGDSKYIWRCVNCGCEFDDDEITPEDVQAGRCPEPDCSQYHYKYVALYAPDGYCVGVLHNDPGKTNGDWEQVLTTVDTMPKSVINHGLDTYAHHTGCAILTEVPLRTVQLTGWVLKTYSEPWPSIEWTVGGPR